MTTTGVTFSAWSRDRPIGLGRVLETLGPRAIGSIWTLRGVEVAPGPSAEQLHDLSDKGDPVDGRRLAELAAPEVQVIEGDLTAIEPGSADPWLVLRAIDGTSWDVLSADVKVLDRITDRFTDARRLPDG
jgi:hypothetical protein